MYIQSRQRKVWVGLGLLGLSYALLGWHLAAHHVLWFVGALFAIIGVNFVWQSRSLWEKRTSVYPPAWVQIILGCLLGSLLIVFAIVQSTVSTLMLIALLATVYAEVEMRLGHVSDRQRYLFLLLIVCLGLGLGEAIDLIVIPSARY